MKRFFFCIFLAGCVAANAAVRSHVGCESGPITGDIQQRMRTDLVNPGWIRFYLRWNDVQPDPNTWKWVDADGIVNLHYSKGRKLMATVFPYPQWAAALTQDQWLAARDRFVRAVVARYGDKLAALECCNEPYVMRPDTQAWGYIPGITSNVTATLIPTLVRIYKSDKRAVQGTHIKLAGPSCADADWHEFGAKLFDNGARGLLDICTYHDYHGRFFHPYQSDAMGLNAQQRAAAWKNAAGGIPLFVNELGLYGRSASSAAHPNTGNPSYISGFSERDAIRDATLWAVMLRAGGADVIIPHVLINGCDNPSDNIEIGGWEFKEAGMKTDPGMKSKTAAFLNTMDFLQGLTMDQIQQLATLARRLTP